MQSKDVSAASDVYALGMSMFEMVTGLKLVRQMTYFNPLRQMTYFNPLLHLPQDTPEMVSFNQQKEDPNTLEHLIARMLEDV